MGDILDKTAPGSNSNCTAQPCNAALRVDKTLWRRRHSCQAVRLPGGLRLKSAGDGAIELARLSQIDANRLAGAQPRTPETLAAAAIRELWEEQPNSCFYYLLA
jgi:hypothetical protein